MENDKEKLPEIGLTASAVAIIGGGLDLHHLRLLQAVIEKHPVVIVDDPLEVAAPPQIHYHEMIAKATLPECAMYSREPGWKPSKHHNYKTRKHKPNRKRMQKQSRKRNRK